MLSIYNSNAFIDDRIHYLKFYETYDGVPTNQKLHQILTEYKAKYSEIIEKIIDAILYTRNIHSGRGLRDLTYSYLFTLQQFIPMKTVFILYIHGAVPKKTLHARNGYTLLVSVTNCIIISVRQLFRYKAVFIRRRL